MVGGHKWVLVGPWYRWHTEEDPYDQASSRPVLQKYPDSGLIDEFLKNPQHSLKYLDEDKTSANRRKVYLETHSRFYLVVCALHCDAAGFPKVRRDRVCEAGFVVRRRQTPVPEGIKPKVEKLLREIAHHKARLQRVRGKQRQVKSGVFGAKFGQTLNAVVAESKQGAEHKYAARLNQTRQSLTELLRGAGVETKVQGWRRSVPGLGGWGLLDEETPEAVSEQIYPLYPLIPDENDKGHPSGHKTLWYGLLPVSSSEVDAGANPQFDERSIYEVRCFVRRHQPHCQKSNERNDCKGEIVWSSPTEAYQLAPHFDLLGTSNRTTTIQAPDLQALQEQAEDPNFQMGQGLGFAVATPQDSNLPINLDGDDKPAEGSRSGPPSICFFAIPLITLIALFVLRLFLPIVVFLFGLWFLLRLKLCILPTIEIDLGAELDAGLEGKLALDVDLEAALTVELGGAAAAGFISKLDDLKNDMPQSTQDALDKMEDAEKYRTLARIAIDQSLDFSGSGIAPDIVRQLAENPGLPEVGDKQRSSLPDPSARLQYYPTKTVQEVFT